MAEPLFTYGGDPSASDRDGVRFLIGDTDVSAPLLDDREVDHAIATEVNLHMAAAFLADHLCARFSRKADFTVGPVSKSFSKVAEAYAKKAASLKKYACRTAVPSFPATSRSTKHVLEANDDLENPSFRKGQFDNPFSVQFDDTISGDDFDGNP